MITRHDRATWTIASLITDHVVLGRVHLNEVAIKHAHVPPPARDVLESQKDERARDLSSLFLVDLTRDISAFLLR